MTEAFQPPTTGISQATGIANAGHAAHAHGQMHGAQHLAELKASRPSRFGFLGRLLNRLGNRSR